MLGREMLGRLGLHAAQSLPHLRDAGRDLATAVLSAKVRAVGRCKGITGEEPDHPEDRSADDPDSEGACHAAEEAAVSIILLVVRLVHVGSPSRRAARVSRPVEMKVHTHHAYRQAKNTHCANLYLG